MPEFTPISNPYIVGNPIKSKEMFFGRLDDFEYIKRKLLGGVRSYIIVFCGERRSGKTSILFQVLNGELGEHFLPIMIDMQTMAGLQSEGEFFEKIAKEIFKALDKNSINPQDYNFLLEETSPYKVFDKLLDDIHARYPDKNILFLIDEYELIESKIGEGSLNKNFIPYLAGVLESERKISFLFTGSKKLDERKAPYWNILFAKSLYRNVSFLSKNDTVRLITDPIKEYVSYDEEVINRIYRLTAGQPFYTQVVCQNIVDHLNETQKNFVDSGDLDEIVQGILENPLPQMIYFWNSLSNEKKLILSLLSETLSDSESFIQAQELHKFSRKREFGINLTLKTVSTALEALYHQQLLNKSEQSYNFSMDLFRSWIKQDHSFWQVMKEISTDISGINVEDSVSIAQTGYTEEPSFFEQEKRSKSKLLVPVIGAALVVVVLAGYWLFSRSSPGTPDQAEQSMQPEISENIVANDEAPDKGSASTRSTPEKSEKSSADKSRQTSTATKSSESIGRTDAINSRTSMLKVKNEAQQLGAENTSSYQQGLSRENQAEKALQTGQHESASRLFAQAARDYSNAKSGISENLSNEVNSLLQEVNTARERAQTNNARNLARNIFSQAEAKENQGRSLFNQGSYEESKTALSEARRLYSSAASEANRSAGKLTGEIKTIQNSLQQFKTQSGGEHQYLNEYQNARGEERKADNFFQNGDYASALASYQKAERLYRQAQAKHNDSVKQIQSIIEKYRLALESRDIQQMMNLHSNLTKQDQERWSQFFKTVNDLQVEFSVKSIRFMQEIASSTVAVRLVYSGAKSSGTWVNWEMHFSETPSGWIISNISESK